MEAIETIERAGYVASIYYDMEPSSPADWDTFGTPAYDTRGASVNRDNLPSDPYGNGRWTDSCPACDGTGWNERKPSGHGSGECPTCKGEGYVTDGAALARRLHGAVAVLPVYAWDDRNGTELRIADSWDEANGWIYATQESADMTGVPVESYEAALKSELREWQQWAQGDVYGIVVTDPSGNEVDACWGFYGMDYALEEARGMLDIEPVRLLESNPELANLRIN